jgi:hypothetical protein
MNRSIGRGGIVVLETDADHTGTVMTRHYPKAALNGFGKFFDKRFPPEFCCLLGFLPGVVVVGESEGLLFASPPKTKTENDGLLLEVP